MITENSTVVVSVEQVSTGIDDEIVILSLRNGVYYGLDPVGTRIWNLIQKPHTFAEVRDTLLTEYNVDASRLESDMRDLIGKLVDHRLVELGQK